MIGVERAKTSPNRRNVMEMVLLSAPISAKCGSSMAKMHPLPNQQSTLSIKGSMMEGDCACKNRMVEDLDENAFMSISNGLPYVP